MIIRTATASDFPQFIRLYTELHGKSPIMENADGERIWNEVLNHQGTRLVCAEMDRQIIGSVTLHVLPNMTYGGRPYGLIENVITSAEFRSQGIGRQLMEQAITHAWEKNCYKIMLLTGNDRGAEAFYHKLGFSSDEKNGMILRREKQC